MNKPLTVGRRPVIAIVTVLVVVALASYFLSRGSGNGPAAGVGQTFTPVAAQPSSAAATQGFAVSVPTSAAATSASAQVVPSASATTQTTTQTTTQATTPSSAPASAASTSVNPKLGAGLVAGKVLSGVAGASTQGAADFGTLRGKPVEVVVNYASVESWQAMDDLARNGLLYRGTPASVHRVFSLPLIPSDHSSTLADGAAGKDDVYFRSFAEQLVQGNQQRATIRIGWEMTGNWFAWNGQKDPTDWVLAYRKAVDAMRSVPHQQFTFDWNVSLGFADPEPLYPGDAYVDIIGADHYDVSFGISPSDHQAVWQRYLDQPKGLTWLASFAAAHGKRMSFPEWGLSNRCDGHGGNDDPYFIQAMHDWIAQHDVAYEAYYEAHDAGVCADFDFTSGKFPQSEALYRQLFGGSA